MYIITQYAKVLKKRTRILTKKYRLYAAFSVFLLLQLSNFRAGLTLENLVKMTNIFNCGIDDIVFGEEKAKKETQTTSLENFTMQDIVQALQMLKTIKG